MPDPPVRPDARACAGSPEDQRNDVSAHSPQDAKSRIYRSDIQGLRAVGALLVAVYHIWIGRVSGGVDVFFVISGYLLIGSLGRQLEKTGQLDLRTFLARLANRLLPAAFFVLGAVLATGWLWLPQSRWQSTIEQVAASAAYVENWYLALNSVDYLARDQIPSPVQHYWAMSAQVQALVIVAVLLFSLAGIARLMGCGITRRAIVSVLLAVFALSFAYSVVTTARNQPFAYFDTVARIWEFVLGGLLGLGVIRLRIADRLAEVVSWVGLVGILSCGLILHVSRVFPGYAALWPVGAAAMILVVGHGRPSRFGAGRLLASRPLVWLGGRAYALYLWHWPLLVAYLRVSGRSQAGLGDGLAVLLVSIGLAHWSTRQVEERFRRPGDSLSVKHAALVSVFALGIIGVGLAGWAYGRHKLVVKELAFDPPQTLYPGALAMSPDGFDAGSELVYPGPFLAGWRLPGREGCTQRMGSAEVIACTYGPEAAPRTLVLVGGSHSAQWIPALRIAIAQLRNWKLVTYTKAACPFSTDMIARTEEFRASCAEWNRRVMEQLLELRPDAVFLVATRTSYPGQDGPEHVPEGYRSQWLRLMEHHIPVVSVRDTPRPGLDVPECVELYGRHAQRCQRERKQVLADSNPALALAEANRLNVVDLSDWFCTREICPPVVGNILVYRDRGHITPAYMRSLGGVLRERLTPLLLDIQPSG